MMNQTVTPDRDSLMALHALLKIRSDSVVETEQETNTATNVCTPTKQRVAISSSGERQFHQCRNEKPRENLDHYVPPPPPTKQAGSTGGQPFSHVTPPFGAMSPRSSLSPSFTLNYDAHDTKAAAGASPGTHVAETSALYSPVVPEPVTVLSSSTVAIPLSLSSSLSKTKGKKTQGQGFHRSTQPQQRMQRNEPVASADTAQGTSAIRVDEIEAALKSKPQRGRKRDNLSELERLELTRTRNREHAKSTRIRKKARYQELVDNEEKYQALIKVQELRELRSECVCRFLSIRESVLRTSLDKKGEPELSSSSSLQQPSSGDTSSCFRPQQQPGLVTPQRVVKFKLLSSGTSHDPSTSSSKMALSFGEQDNSSALDTAVDLAAFDFSVVGGTLAMTTTAETERPSSPFSRMYAFDNSLAARVEGLMGTDLVKTLSYKLENLAINDKGTGFAQVVVTVRDGDHRCFQLVTAILKLDFGPNSTKLKSVVWNVTEERFDLDAIASSAEDASDCPSSSSSESSLGCQTSFPSMVSLDQSGDAAAPGEKSSGEDPGMNI